MRIGTSTYEIYWQENNACLVALLRVTRTSGWTGSSRSWEKRGSHDWFHKVDDVACGIGMSGTRVPGTKIVFFSNGEREQKKKKKLRQNKMELVAVSRLLIFFSFFWRRRIRRGEYCIRTVRAALSLNIHTYNKHNNRKILGKKVNYLPSGWLHFLRG